MAAPVERHDAVGVALTRIIAIAGLPGGGKTRLAAVLAPTFDAQVVSRDQIRVRHFADIPVEQGKAKAFEAMLALVELQRGRRRIGRRNLVLEGMPFSGAEQVEAVDQAARIAGAAVDWLWLDVPVAVARKRIAGQAHHEAPDRTVEIVEHVAARFRPPPRARRINGDQPFLDVYHDAVAALL